MLKLLGASIRFVLMSLIVLVLGQRMTWQGRTLSSQVNQGFSTLERVRVFSRAQDWMGDWVDQVRMSLFRIENGPTQEDVSSRDQRELKKMMKHRRS